MFRGAGKMAQWIRAPTALPKVQSSNRSNHLVYRVNSRIAKVTQRNPVLNNNKSLINKQTNKKMKRAQE